MKRRRFTAAVVAGAGTLLAGCSSGSDSTTTSETAGTGTTANDATTSAGGTPGTDATTEAQSTADGTEESETSTPSETSRETTSTTSVQSLSYRQYGDLSNGLRIAVTDARSADSYEQGGESQTPSDGNTFLVVQFTVENTGQSAASLPDGATPSVRTSDGSYGLVSSSQSTWTQYRSSSIEAGASAEQTVAFEVPEKAASSLGTSIELSYSASSTERVVRWSME
jgi:hypothetical protein